jgi:hypothetical protein
VKKLPIKKLNASIVMSTNNRHIMLIIGYINQLLIDCKTNANHRTILKMAFRSIANFTNLITDSTHEYKGLKSQLTLVEAILQELISNNQSTVTVEIKAIFQVVHITNHISTDDSMTLEILMDTFLLKALIAESEDEEFLDEITTLAHLLIPTLQCMPISTSITDQTISSTIKTALTELCFNKPTMYNFTTVDLNDVVFQIANVWDFNIAYNYFSHYLIGSERLLVLDEISKLGNIEISSH